MARLIKLAQSSLSRNPQEVKRMQRFHGAGWRHNATNGKLLQQIELPKYKKLFPGTDGTT
jgi:hypothetical protein